jgi:hypothetical protein
MILGDEITVPLGNKLKRYPTPQLGAHQQADISNLLRHSFPGRVNREYWQDLLAI